MHNEMPGLRYPHAEHAAPGLRVRMVNHLSFED